MPPSKSNSKKRTQRNHNKKGCSLGKHDVKTLLFIKYYLINGNNGRRAAMMAGFSIKSAHTIANQLLQKPDVRNLIESEWQRMLSDADINAQEVLAHIKVLATAPLQERISNDSKLKALEMLAKNQKLLTDKVEHGISEGLAAQIEKARKRTED